MPRILPSLFQLLRTQHARKNTVPQIYVGEELLGGCDSLLKEVDSGTFFERLQNNNIVRQLVDPAITTASAAVFTDSRNQDSQLSLSATSLLIASIDGVLNNIDMESDPGSVKITDPLLLSSALQRLALLLTDQFSSADGSRVDYKKMKMSTEFLEYVRLSSSLQECSLASISNLSTQRRISFFVNLYNAMIIHANCILVSADTALSVSIKCCNILFPLCLPSYIYYPFSHFSSLFLRFVPASFIFYISKISSSRNFVRLSFFFYSPNIYFYSSHLNSICLRTNCTLLQRIHTCPPSFYSLNRIY